MYHVLLAIDPAPGRDTSVPTNKMEIALDKGPVIIVDYNPNWPQMYEQEKARIQDAVGEYLIDIQHVGSTSIPGLSAKPILDIMPVIRDIALIEHCVQPLAALDYAYAGENGIPGRHYFRKPIDNTTQPSMVHLHVVEKGHDQWAMMLLFREYLRLHPQSAQQYDILKRELAATYGSDRVGYTDAKAAFVKSIIRAAVLEAMSEKKKSLK